MSRPRAVVFGAGKMACGLLGQLLTHSGYETLFVGRRPEIIEAINRRQGYRLTIAGEKVRRLAIRNCAACSIRDICRVADAVAGADAVFTAVFFKLHFYALSPGCGYVLADVISPDW